MTLSLTISNLSPGSSYLLIKYDDEKKVPTSSFASAANLAKAKKITTISAVSSTYALQEAIVSSDKAIYRCVLNPIQSSTSPSPKPVSSTSPTFKSISSAAPSYKSPTFVVIPIFCKLHFIFIKTESPTVAFTTIPSSFPTSSLTKQSNTSYTPPPLH
jgi:hypothetical protein